MLYMNREYGNMVTWEEMWMEANEYGYDDMTDPTSVEYGHWSLYYVREDELPQWYCEG